MRGLLQRTLSLTRPMVASMPSPLLQPSLFSPLSLAVRSMKVVSSLKKRCESCYIVKRGTIAYVYCKANPRHKARQGPKRRRK